MLQLAHPAKRVYPHHRFEEKVFSRAEIEPESPVWQPPILKTVATEGAGMVELYGEIARHREFLEGTGEWERRDRLRLQSELDVLLQAALVTRWRETVSQEVYQDMVNRLVERSISPWHAVETLLDAMDKEIS
jgi:LAO/AO transport system kinase